MCFFLVTPHRETIIFHVVFHPNKLFTLFSILFPAPAIRVVDEQDNEIHDRYYKIGSKIDLTCQVATKFITKNATSKAKTQFSLLQRPTDIQLPPTPPPTLFPPISAFDIKENEIDMSERATLRVAVNDSIFQRIRWTKDGENVSKDAVFNLRYAISCDLVIWLKKSFCSKF